MWDIFGLKRIKLDKMSNWVEEQIFITDLAGLEGDVLVTGTHEEAITVPLSSQAASGE